jgi:hypothetical protein
MKKLGIILSILILLGCENNSPVTAECDVIITDTIHVAPPIKVDSLFLIADKLVDDMYVQQTSMDDKIHEQGLTIADKKIRLNSALTEVDKSRTELEKAINDAEIAKNMSLKSKIEFEAKIISLKRHEDELAFEIEAIKNERRSLIIERDNLKLECQRLNSLLGNDYNISEIDSIIILPDSLKITNKKSRGKKRNKNK